jgi:hypothetical protein
MPMREVVLCLKDAPHETDPQILAFRAELEACKGVRVIRYSRVEELRRQCEEVCVGWAESAIQPKGEMSPE